MIDDRSKENVMSRFEDSPLSGGAWLGIFVGVDLIPRKVTAALDVKGNQISGEIAFAADDKRVKKELKLRGTVSGKVDGSRVSFTVTLPVTAQEQAGVTLPVLEFSGDFSNQPLGRQVILALTDTSTSGQAGRKVVGKGSSVPFIGTLILKSTPATTAMLAAQQPEAGWMEG